MCVASKFTRDSFVFVLCDIIAQLVVQLSGRIILTITSNDVPCNRIESYG